MYKITETTDDRYIGLEVEFTFDPIYIDEGFTFEWDEIRRTSRTTFTVSNSNYSMTLERI